MSIFALDKLARLCKIVKHNGGIIGTFSALWRTDTLKEGTLMGCDIAGNKYYENNRYMLSRNRWVEYNPAVKFEYDPSQIEPAWFGWIHYRTDRTPCEDCAKYCLDCCCLSCRWLAPHRENPTGTDQAYYPYRTTKPHIYVWDGHSVCNRPSLPTV